MVKDFVFVCPDTTFTNLVSSYPVVIPALSLLVGRGMSGEPEIVKSISPIVSNINSEFWDDAICNPSFIGVVKTPKLE